jgi:GNAT superfamily N-acetyltransferase
MMKIGVAEKDEEIAACFSVIHELRGDVVQSDFVETVRRLQAGGYQLAVLTDEGKVRAVAGFRIQEMLWCGLHLYVDDLVTENTARSRGYGHALLSWLAEKGRARGCRQLQLDSGVQRFDAHRFYFRERMHIAAYHFVVDL